MHPQFLPFESSIHRTGVVQLWVDVFGYDAPHNDPELVIDRKLAVEDGLFFVATADGEVIGSVMAGYDGHRGWIYSLAVLPEPRHQGIGSALVARAETALVALRCVKINMQIAQGNEAVEAFYRSLGYEPEVRLSMGKKLSVNIPSRD